MQRTSNIFQDEEAVEYKPGARGTRARALMGVPAACPPISAEPLKLCCTTSPPPPPLLLLLTLLHDRRRMLPSSPAVTATTSGCPICPLGCPGLPNAGRPGQQGHVVHLAPVVLHVGASAACCCCCRCCLRGSCMWDVVMQLSELLHHSELLAHESTHRMHYVQYAF